MNSLSDFSNAPEDVVFFIGPCVAPEGIKRNSSTAIDPSSDGDYDAPDETLEIVEQVLCRFAGHSPEEASALRDLLTGVIEQKMGLVSTFVGTGRMKGVWTPTLTIHLNRSKTVDGTPLGELLRKEDAAVIASILGLCFKAEWIYWCWIWPADPDQVES